MDSQKGKFALTLGASMLGAAIITFAIYKHFFTPLKKKDSRRQSMLLEEPEESLEISPPIQFKTLHTLDTTVVDESVGFVDDTVGLVDEIEPIESRVQSTPEVRPKESEDVQMIEEIFEDVVSSVVTGAQLGASPQYHAPPPQYNSPPSVYVPDEQTVFINRSNENSGHNIQNSNLDSVESPHGYHSLPEPELVHSAKLDSPIDEVIKQTITSPVKCEPVMFSGSSSVGMTTDDDPGNQANQTTDTTEIEDLETKIDDSSKLIWGQSGNSVIGNSCISEDSVTDCMSVTDSGIGIGNSASGDKQIEILSVSDADLGLPPKSTYEVPVTVSVLFLLVPFYLQSFVSVKQVSLFLLVYIARMLHTHPRVVH